MYEQAENYFMPYPDNTDHPDWTRTRGKEALIREGKGITTFEWHYIGAPRNTINNIRKEF
jgi:hypothetical protein